MSRACLGLVVSLTAVLAADAAAAGAPTRLKDPFATPATTRPTATGLGLKDPFVASAVTRPPISTGLGLKDPFVAAASPRTVAPDRDLKDPWARAPLRDPIAAASLPASHDGLKDPWAEPLSPPVPTLVDPSSDAPAGLAAPGDPALIDPFTRRRAAEHVDPIRDTEAPPDPALVDPVPDTRAPPDPDLLDPFAARRETAVAPPRSPDLIDPFAPRATPRQPPIQRPRARPPAAR